jgi:MFS family permease
VAVLADRNVAALVTGQTLSQLGDKLNHMALIALVGASSSVGSSGFALATLAVVFTLPVVVFGPVAGVLVDRWDRRRTLIVCDVLRAGLVALVPIAYHATRNLLVVYALSFVIFLLGLFFNSAKMAIIPDLVDRSQLLATNAVANFVGRFATVIGIVAGGLIVGWTSWERVGWEGWEAGFYLDSGSYLVSVVTLALLSPLAGRIVAAHPNAGRSDDRDAGIGEVVERVERSLLHDFKRGIGYIRDEPPLRFIYATVVLLGVIAATAYVVVVVAVQSVLGRGTEGVGVLGGTLAMGLILGSLLVGTVGRRLDKRLVVQGSCILLGVVMAACALFFDFAWLTPLAFVGGVLLAPVMVSHDTLLHEASPAGSRGVIFSARELVLSGSFMVTSLAVGGAIALMAKAGVQEPYRLALLVLGVVIVVAGAATEGLRRDAARSWAIGVGTDGTPVGGESRAGRGR